MMATKRPEFYDQRCQETVGMIGDDYIRCEKPAVMLIQHRSRAEGPYYMCLECGTHNLDNRNAELLAGSRSSTGDGEEPADAS